MKKPILSIITVCYNADVDLEKTILSVLNQSFANFEYLIIDGASKDNTINLLKKYKAIFENRNLVFNYISEKDDGTYDAMNKGADLAKGSWINYLNAGDIYSSENSLNDFFSTTIHDKVGVCYGNTIEEYAFGEGQINDNEEHNSNPTMPFCHQSSFIRTELMRKYRYDLHYKIIADHDLFYRLRRDRVVFQHFPVTISRYNAQYGLSATHPLTLHIERLKIYGKNKKWYYPFLLIFIFFRQGMVQPLKNLLPRTIVSSIMKRRRKYIC